MLGGASESMRDCAGWECSAACNCGRAACATLLGDRGAGAQQVALPAGPLGDWARSLLQVRVLVRPFIFEWRTKPTWHAIVSPRRARA